MILISQNTQQEILEAAQNTIFIENIIYSNIKFMEAHISSNKKHRFKRPEE